MNTKNAVVGAALLIVSFYAATDGPVAEDKKVITIPRNETPFTNFEMRGNLMRSYNVFTGKKAGRVAYMGGSVTTRQWRLPVQKWLDEKFPETAFDFVMAGIGGTPASLGAFRLENDVFKNGKVDLFFLEFAVNGGGVREMEGIVRHARRLNPEIDIVLMYFANTDHTETFNQGKTPKIVEEHEIVAKHYGIPALFLYREIAERIRDKKLEWKDFSKDTVHPHQGGCDIYAACIVDFLAKAWENDKLLAEKPGEIPAKLDPLCLEKGRYVSPDETTGVKDFAWIRDWTPSQPTCNFRPPVDVFAAEKPGAELTLTFEGTAVGVYVISGADAGTIEYSIDGGEFVAVDLFNKAYGPRFQLPREHILTTELEDKKHTLVVRVSDKRHKLSTGHAMRILKFLVN